MNKIYFAFAYLYCVWGRIYRYVERKKVKSYDAIVAGYRARISEMSVPRRWNFVRSVMIYKNDTSSMLGDVVSDPYLSLRRGGDDCDGFASVGRMILGEEFEHNNKVFKFEGLFSCLYKGLFYNIIKKKATGHMIAVWRSGNKFSFVSTYRLVLDSTFEDVLDALQGGSDGWIFSKFKIIPGAYFNINPEKVYTKKQFYKLY